jgi:hypothetical protein
LYDVRYWVTSIVQRADQLDRTLLDVMRSGTLILMFYMALVETKLEASVYAVLCACSAIPTRYQVQYNQSVTKRRMIDLWKWSLALSAAESMGFLLCLGFRPSTLYQLRSVIEGSELYRTTFCLFVCAPMSTTNLSFRSCFHRPTRSCADTLSGTVAGDNTRPTGRVCSLGIRVPMSNS